MKRIIGGIILATPIIGLYALGVYSQGWIMATLGALIVFCYVALIALGAALLAD